MKDEQLYYLSPVLAKAASAFATSIEVPMRTAGEIHLLGSVFMTAGYFIETRHYGFSHTPERTPD